MQAPLPTTRRAFTLLETLLALFIFSVAIVALVEAVNQLGQTTLLRRREAILQDRLRSLLVEHSRLLWKKPAPTSAVTEKVLEEDGVVYTLQVAPLDLQNQDGQVLNEMLEVTIQAAWTEGRVPQTASATTWVYLPLFRPGP
ncbi:MAG: prepilin-type N-terminal cleavage/methylation domain-containing protein [Verrucomicrobiaceae bacterium]